MRSSHICLSWFHGGNVETWNVAKRRDCREFGRLDVVRLEFGRLDVVRLEFGRLDVWTFGRFRIRWPFGRLTRNANRDYSWQWHSSDSWQDSSSSSISRLQLWLFRRQVSPVSCETDNSETESLRRQAQAGSGRLQTRQHGSPMHGRRSKSQLWLNSNRQRPFQLVSDTSTSVRIYYLNLDLSRMNPVSSIDVSNWGQPWQIGIVNWNWMMIDGSLRITWNWMVCHSLT